MRGANHVRWVYAALAAFVGALFLYVAVDVFTEDGQANERLVASAIGGAFCLIGCALAPVWRR